METELTLVRHGRTTSNEKGLILGHGDVPLDEVGLQQVCTLGEIFADREFDLIVSSSSKRAIETAEAIRAKQRSQLEIYTTDLLRERDFGPFEDWPIGPFNRAVGRHYPIAGSMGYPEIMHVQIHPKVETDISIWQRFQQFIELLKSDFPDRQNILVATHSGVMQAVLEMTEGQGMYRFGRAHLKNACYAILGLDLQTNNLTIKGSEGIDFIE